MYHSNRTQCNSHLNIIIALLTFKRKNSFDYLNNHYPAKNK